MREDPVHENPHGRPPVSAEATPEDGVRVGLDAVTPRELHEHLSKVYEKVDEVDDKVTESRISFERRLGRMERGLLALTAAVVAPKLGGPDLPGQIAGLVHSLLS